MISAPETIRSVIGMWTSSSPEASGETGASQSPGRVRLFSTRFSSRLGALSDAMVAPLIEEGSGLYIAPFSRAIKSICSQIIAFLR